MIFSVEISYTNVERAYTALFRGLMLLCTSAGKPSTENSKDFLSTELKILSTVAKPLSILIS